MLTYEMAHNLLKYDPRTGIFRWKGTGSGRKSDGLACRKTSQRYGRISHKGINYQAHNIAWLLTYGEFPKGFIDHINNDCWDNRIKNLRDVTRSQNMRNLKMHRAGKLFGTHWSERLRKYQCAINVNGQGYYLGVFTDKRECNAFAEKAYEDILKGKAPLKRLTYRK